MFEPSRLTLARRRRGLSKAALATLAGVPIRTLKAYENGEYPPPADRQQELARALRFPSEFFDRTEVEHLDTEGVSFRSLSRMKASQRDTALAAGEMALELSRWLEARFGLPDPDVPDLSQLKTPEAAAIALRSRWALGDQPISSMVRLLEKQGVRVFSLAEEHDALDGFSFWRDGKPFVFLNTMKSAERSRFDAAHELAHLVLHRHGHPAGRDVEHEAHAFASAFLMPRTSILAHAPRFATIDRLIEAKRGWGVSVAALAHRMHAVGMMSDWQYRNLCIQMGQTGIRTNEPNPCPRELSLAFEKMFDALRRDQLSKHAVARELSWPLAELNSLVFGLVLAATPGSGSGPVLSGPKPKLSLVRPR